MAKTKNIMKKFEEKKFNIGELKGISAKSIEEHLKLYAGYVKNANLIFEKLEEYMPDPEKNMYVIGELHRRYGFEFNGVKNHEYYFKSLEGGAKKLPENSKLKKAIETECGTFEAWLDTFKILAMTRGIGWAVLAYDKEREQILHLWVDEQHIGQINNVEWLLALDMWEHAYYLDYTPAEKKKYVEAFFENLNWEIIEENFKNAL